MKGLKNDYIENVIKQLHHIYFAHTKIGRSKELLASHLEKTFMYYQKMEEEKNLDTIVKNIIKTTFSITDVLVEQIYDLFKQAIYYHDIGKINPLFQKNKMENDLKIEIENTDDTHAALSARIYIDSVIDIVKNETIQPPLERTLILYIGYYFRVYYCKAS